MSNHGSMLMKKAKASAAASHFFLARPFLKSPAPILNFDVTRTIFVLLFRSLGKLIQQLSTSSEPPLPFKFVCGRNSITTERHKYIHSLEFATTSLGQQHYCSGLDYISDVFTYPPSFNLDIISIRTFSFRSPIFPLSMCRLISVF